MDSWCSPDRFSQNANSDGSSANTLSCGDILRWFRVFSQRGRSNQIWSQIAAMVAAEVRSFRMSERKPLPTSQLKNGLLGTHFFLAALKQAALIKSGFTSRKLDTQFVETQCTSGNQTEKCLRIEAKRRDWRYTLQNSVLNTRATEGTFTGRCLCLGICRSLWNE